MPYFRPAQGSASEWLNALEGLINPLATIIGPGFANPLVRKTLIDWSSRLSDKFMPGRAIGTQRFSADPNGLFSMMFGNEMRGDNARLLPQLKNHQDAYEAVLKRRMRVPTEDEAETFKAMLGLVN